MELLDDAGWDFGQAFLWVEGQQFPGQVEGVIEVTAFVLTLRDEFMLKLLQKLQVVEVLLCQCLNRRILTY